MRLKRIGLIFLLTIPLGVGAFWSTAADAEEMPILTSTNQEEDFLLPSYFDAPEEKALPPQKNETTEFTAPQGIPSDMDILTEIFGEGAIPASVSTPSERVFYPSAETNKTVSAPKTQKNVLTKLPPLPAAPEPAVAPPKNNTYSSDYAAKAYASLSGKSAQYVQMPKDIRLQFNPNATQLNESLIRWIKAYALYVKKDPRLVVNLRVSTFNWPVQQARLSLIMQIMLENGLSVRQMQIFQSNRNPDTVIINVGMHPEQTKIVEPIGKKPPVQEQKTLIW